MSSVIQSSGEVRSATAARPRSMVNLKPAIFTMIGITVLMAGYRIYQQIYAWSAGLDSTDPAFETYWMGLLKGELVILVMSWVGLWSWLWVTRDRNLQALKPREEMRRYFNLVLYIMVYAFCVYFTGSFFAEMDASWHQTVVRDTAFTPSHVILFYGTIPLYILFGVGGFLYAMTRLPRFADRISIPYALAVAGPFLILPNLGYNEWGHAFWMMEEFFSAPLHWGFVVLGWSVLALGGLLLQIARHVFEIMGRLEQEAAA
ncbi:MAG: methane monooxygenase/ammonia monooxygenase subunit C [Gammaproteobacteria bacterium]|nr:methane monooxygenase/ammonia monooxygenase subunit C [Gammaproteobacteria bacterium]